MCPVVRIMGKNNRYKLKRIELLSNYCLKLKKKPWDRSNNLVPLFKSTRWKCPSRLVINKSHTKQY